MNRPSSMKKIVKDILTLFSETRDNDQLLLTMVWEHNFPVLNITKDYDLFKKYFISGQLPHFESIRRARQALQQHHPELRGLSYSARHNLSEPEIKQDLSDPQWKKGGTP